MNKKKIGELDGTPIVTGNKNYANEHEYYMTMNGDNTYQKLEQRTNGDQFKLVLGGNGSSNTNSGYNVTKQTVTLFNDTIETQESGGIYQAEIENIDFDLIAGESYTVVFDGTSYTVKATVSPYDEDDVLLGEINGSGPSFETYPFAIMWRAEEGEKGMLLATPTEGSHTVEIKHEEETMTTTPEFKSAVDSVTGYSISEEGETLFDGTIQTESSYGSFYGIITPTITFVEGDTYKVTFNGVEYICKCSEANDALDIGAPFNEGFDEGEDGFDWSTYPFNIETFPTGREQYETSLTTNQEGSCTLKIEHLTTSTKTTPAFVSMIQGIVGGSGSGSDNIIVYPDSVSFIDVVYSAYNNPPEQGKIYFIPFSDIGSPYGQYLYPVHIDELTNDYNEFTGRATIIGNPIVIDNGTLTAQPFNHTINPSSNTTKGLCILYDNYNNNYRLFYGAIEVQLA